MSEKEFLEKFILKLKGQTGGMTVFYNMQSEIAALKSIDSFLEEIRKEYYEVEFIEKEDESQFIYADNLIKETYADDDNPEIEWIEVESNFAKEQRYK